MQHSSKPLTRHADILTEIADCRSGERKLALDHSKRQGAEKPIHVGNDRIFIPTLRTFDYLNAFEYDVVHTALSKAVRSSFNGGFTVAVRATCQECIHVLSLPIFLSPER